MFTKCRCCGLMWLSGFFALATLAHAVRLVFKVSVQVGEFAVPMELSVVILVVAGTLSFVMARLGCGRCDCGGNSDPSC